MAGIQTTKELEAMREALDKPDPMVTAFEKIGIDPDYIARKWKDLFEMPEQKEALDKTGQFVTSDGVPSHSSKARALENMAKLSGYSIERKELSGKGGGAIIVESHMPLPDMPPEEKEVIVGEVVKEIAE